MGETRFQYLSVEERRLALRKAQAEGPHPAFLLEKDIWVVATLNILFKAPFGRHLVFKGGTSRALANRELALSVARHKAMFFRENDSNGHRIDYEAAVSGNLRLVPSGAAQEALAEDYGRMLAIGMLLDEDEPFGALMQRCALIEERANAAWATDAQR